LSATLIPSIAMASGMRDTGSQTTHTFQPNTVTLVFFAGRLARTSGRFSLVTLGTSLPSSVS
jgi:hypothetical protein